MQEKVCGVLCFLLFFAREKNVRNNGNELRARGGEWAKVAGAMKDGKRFFLSLLCLFYLPKRYRLEIWAQKCFQLLSCFGGFVSPWNVFSSFFSLTLFVAHYAVVINVGMFIEVLPVAQRCSLVSSVTSLTTHAKLVAVKTLRHFPFFCFYDFPVVNFFLCLFCFREGERSTKGIKRHKSWSHGFALCFSPFHLFFLFVHMNLI